MHLSRPIDCKPFLPSISEWYDEQYSVQISAPWSHEGSQKGQHIVETTSLNISRTFSDRTDDSTRRFSELSSDTDGTSIAGSFDEPPTPSRTPIPEQGWLDRQNWLHEIVRKATSKCSSEELLRRFFQREKRPTYGETQAFRAALKKRRVQKGRASSHRWEVERNRRHRHKVLQREGDNCTSSFVYDLAKKKLDYVKEHIEENFPVIEDAPQDTVNPKDETGKDLQHLSSAMFYHFAAIVVISENDLRKKAEQECENLRREIEALKSGMNSSSPLQPLTQAPTPTSLVAPQPRWPPTGSDYERR